MAIKQSCHCDKCNKVLEEATDGFIILGNIHVIGSPKNEFIGGGVIGNNIKGDKIGDGAAVFRHSHYCKQCIAELLKILPTQPR